MVVVMTLGMTLSVQATENTMDENNLYGEPFRIIDQNGNVMITGRLGISNPTIPVGAGAEWDVNVVTGNNTMSVGVTPAANLQLQVTNSVGFHNIPIIRQVQQLIYHQCIIHRHLAEDVIGSGINLRIQ